MHSTQLGISKTIFNSSAAIVTGRQEAEVFVTERLNRKKNSGLWPKMALEKILQKYPFIDQKSFFENRDIEHPSLIEQSLNRQFPFYESLRAQGLQNFLSENTLLAEFTTHHRAHADSSLFLNPFEKTIILVLDGAGNRAHYFSDSHEEYAFAQNAATPASCEERSVYLWNNSKLTCVEKKWQTFRPSKKHSEHHFSEGLGSFYEKISEFIFNSKTQSGKVMGLAALGKPLALDSRIDFLENLDWSLAFKGKKKKDWEASPAKEFYIQLAATAQHEFEKDLLGYLHEVKKKYPEYENIILAGGCALNCTTNMKIVDAGIFKNVFVTPFPGDEGISLGLAFGGWLKTNSWSPATEKMLISFYGPDHEEQPTIENLQKMFSTYKIEKHENISQVAADLLCEKHVLAWFQGRSEIGPRALGHRSLLAFPAKTGLKNHLNETVKYRESFRPYGCVVPEDQASVYFKVPAGFKNPFMSFACPVQEKYLDSLKEVSHVDQTSRMQTLAEVQNPVLYQVLKLVGKKTGLECLLNTSLNVMDEPIVETLHDLKRFMDSSVVDYCVVESFLISRKS